MPGNNDDLELHVASKDRSAETGLPLDKKPIIDPGEVPLASKEFDPDETLTEEERIREQTLRKALKPLPEK